MALEPGCVIGVDTPEGEELAGMIVATEGDAVEVDFNHPLAGHVVIFDVEIIEVVLADVDS